VDKKSSKDKKTERPKSKGRKPKQQTAQRELVATVRKKQTRVALLEGGKLTELFIEREGSKRILGNIYNGMVKSILPGIQAAFVDIGLEKNGFLYVSNIADAVEDVGDVMDLMDPGKQRRPRKMRSTSITELLEPGQEIMVQVAKEPLGNKGTRLTTFTALPGRFLVLMPTVNQLGISRRIADEAERTRLRKIAMETKPKKMGVIVRTAAAGKSKKDFLAEKQRLTTEWSKIRRRMTSSHAPAVLYEDLGHIERIVRDLFTEDIDKFVIDSREAYKRIKKFLQGFGPGLRSRMELYRNKMPLFEAYGIENEINKALRRKVWLRCGGYIVIEATEALVAIDVNTGKYTGKTKLEDTVFKANVEAAKEIARQVRLRDLGGIIVIDFIDMDSPKNRAEVIRTFSAAMEGDRAKITISELTELGLVEMTRKRVRSSLLKSLSDTCPYCGGTGHVKSLETITLEALSKLEALLAKTRERMVIVRVHRDVHARLTENQMDADLLQEVSSKYRREIVVETGEGFHQEDVEFVNGRTGERIVLDGKPAAAAPAKSRSRRRRRKR